MTMQVAITITGDKETLAKIQKLGRQLYMMKSAMDDIGGELTKYYGGQVFASQGGVINSQWPALSPRYQKWKAKHYPGRGELVRSGAMQEGFKFKADNNSATIYNETSYFKYHQSSAPRSKMPYRPMMKVNKDVRDIVRRIIDKDVHNKIAKAGL